MALAFGGGKRRKESEAASVQGSDRTTMAGWSFWIGNRGRKERDGRSVPSVATLDATLA